MKELVFLSVILKTFYTLLAISLVSLALIFFLVFFFLFSSSISFFLIALAYLLGDWLRIKSKDFRVHWFSLFASIITFFVPIVYICSFLPKALGQLIFAALTLAIILALKEIIPSKELLKKI
jgi:hypothetical protein